jgi:hypothetical protein
MFNLSWWPHLGIGRSGSEASLLADLPHPPGLRWVNFSICPRCKARGRPCSLEGLNEWGPIISRSDGVNFHLVLGDRPMQCPAERLAGKSEMLSAGFWYVHEGNGGSTETVVVTLRETACSRGGPASSTRDSRSQTMRKAEQVTPTSVPLSI